ncbi:hypothetical protein BHE90_002588 [Fusarium euwallaceae]|uniref:Bacteriophage T5 Orf172 DNA-binding domain-containing protein n=1 Tax=Fusarium euwallaceae TaxID=1147111 RepID=A0A430M4E0_9HYPO|nr:hypothetical protein BHE90_002588 [Fusarium euwallaceae]
MPKKKSSATKLDSLYNALEIPQKGKIPCLGSMRSSTACNTDRKRQRENIESTLHGIIDTIENGYTAGSKEVQNLLVDLAQRLICSKKHPKFLVPPGSSVYGKHEYVALVLGSRLMDWHECMDRETSVSTRSSTPTKPRHRKQAGSSDDEDEYVEDGDENYVDEDEEYEYEDGEDEYEDEEDDEKLSEKDSEEDDEEVTASRPKLFRKTACVTPTKQRGRPSHDSRPSTPRMRQGVDAFDSLSVLGDALPSSPESVISPGVSEVFSPVSTASTPMSILDSEIRPSRYWYSRGEEESPTRRQGPSTGDDDLRDVTRRMRDSLKKVGQIKKGLRLDEQDLESEKPTDEEEVEEQPTSKNKKVPLRPLKVGNMRFGPANENKRNAVQLILKRLRQAPMGQSLLPGWVYCFAEKTAPGYLKIGSKISKSSNDDTTLSSENQQNEAEVRKRLQEWELGCKYDIDYKFIVYMPCAVRTMERLVHLTLCTRNRKAYCPNPTCKTKTGHREWFEISEDEARGAVKVWEQFSRLMPYNNKGQLGKFWFDYATDKYNYFSGWPPEKWLYECWANLTGPAAVNHREQVNQLQKKEIDLTERRRQREERKKELEHEIQSLKQEEEEIRRQLAKLQSQN